MPCRIGVYRILPNHYILKRKYINYATYINGLSSLNLAIWASEEFGNVPWFGPTHATKSTTGPFIADASVARATVYQDPKVSAQAAETDLGIDLNQKEHLNDGAAHHLRVYARGLCNFNSRWTRVIVLFRFVGIVRIIYPEWVSTNKSDERKNIN